jgi:phytoene dehydrogenase-like protein
VVDDGAVVVGAGPNGLVAAITLAAAGLRARVVEAAPAPGGGTRSAELTRPGFVHDICSAIHPLALASPALRELALSEHGLRWIESPAVLAHPLDGGRAAVLERSVLETAAGLDADGERYARSMLPLVARADAIVEAVLSPLTVPPATAWTPLARFGLGAVLPAEVLAKARFRTDEGRALLAGLSAHSMLSLRTPTTAGVGRFLGLLGHAVGWPLARGGSQAIADALVSHLRSLGGEIELDHEVRTLDELPRRTATVLDLTPRQVLRLGGLELPSRYRRALGRYRYGPGVWKVDLALDGPIPWAADGCHRAATVHVGGTAEEITAAEADVQRGRHPARPFVLVAQQAAFDDTRAPAGGQTAWAYCHVPNGSTVDMTERIERQIERFAPGFRDRIVDRHVMGPAAMEDHDANHVGGDIGGGAAGPTQLVTRPVVSRSPWRTPVAGVYLCSSATPPGPGVHGMCGWHAAHAVLADRG